MDPAEYEGKCPTNDPKYNYPPICEVDGASEDPWAHSDDVLSTNDFAQMRRLGFNIIRLCLSWSDLEAQPGVYNTMYIDRIAQVVRWAKTQGIYTLLDMHQDQYSRFIFSNGSRGHGALLQPQDGQDGAPAWAVRTDGWPALAVEGQAPLNLASMRAFDHFWANAVLDVPQGEAPGPGLQDHYIGAIAALARRFRNESAVIGFELMNEPVSGTHLESVSFSAQSLYPFYRRAIQAITGVRDGLPDCPADRPTGDRCAYPDLGVGDTRHLVFFEPNALRNTLDVSVQRSAPFTAYPNIVYAPHTYTHVFTIDRVLHVPYTSNIWPPSFDFALVTAVREGTRMKAAVFVTEFGCGVDEDHYILRRMLAAQEKARVGATLWSWKGNCGTAPDCSSWGMFHGANVTGGQNGRLQEPRGRLMSRVYARAVSGELLSMAYDPDNQTYMLVAKASDPATPAVVYIPPTVSGQVAALGCSFVDVQTNPDGSRVVTVSPNVGVYTVTVGSPAEEWVAQLALLAAEAAENAPLPAEEPALAPLPAALYAAYMGSAKAAVSLATAGASPLKVWAALQQLAAGWARGARAILG